MPRPLLSRTDSVKACARSSSPQPRAPRSGKPATAYTLRQRESRRLGIEFRIRRRNQEAIRRLRPPRAVHVDNDRAMTSSHRIGGARRVFVVGVNLASALTVAVLGAPAAAGIWSAPTPPRPCPAAYALDAAGPGGAPFGLQETVGEDQSPPKLQGVWSSLSADGAYGPANQFAFEPTALALFGRAGLAIVGYSGRNGRPLPPYRSELAVGSTRTGLGRAQVLGALRYRVIAPPRLAVDRAGRALVGYGGPPPPPPPPGTAPLPPRPPPRRPLPPPA